MKEKDRIILTKALAISKALSLLSWTGFNMPIWSKLAMKVLTLAGADSKMVDRFRNGRITPEELVLLASKCKGYNVYSDGQRHTNWVEYSREAYLGYLDTHGISPEDVLSIESKIDNIQSLFEVVEISEFVNFFE